LKTGISHSGEKDQTLQPFGIPVKAVTKITG
jgi:hypothetical protein